MTTHMANSFPGSLFFPRETLGTRLGYEMIMAKEAQIDHDKAFIRERRLFHLNCNKVHPEQDGKQGLWIKDLYNLL